MENIYKLKTQLEEAARFAKSAVPGHDRLAVILLDNFVEIQLSRQIGMEFDLDYVSIFNKQVKYPVDARKEILLNYDKLLKACQEEKIVTAAERNVLSFCHDVRNKLYHKGEENKLLVHVALHALHAIILRRQPEWKNGSYFISIRREFAHPFTKKKAGKPASVYSHGSKEDWTDFLKHRFDILDKRKKSASRLLSDFILSRVKSIRRNARYVLTKNAYADFYAEAKGWGFNEFVLHLGFDNLHAEEVKRLREMTDRNLAQKKFQEMANAYKKSYRPVNLQRVKSFEKQAMKIARLPIEQALERYIGLRTPLLTINDAFREAANRLDGAINEAVDRARGK